MCQNGGTCRDGTNKYTCECPAEFTGKFCERAIDPQEWGFDPMRGMYKFELDFDLATAVLAASVNLGIVELGCPAGRCG